MQTSVTAMPSAWFPCPAAGGVATGAGVAGVGVCGGRLRVGHGGLALPGCRVGLLLLSTDLCFACRLLSRFAGSLPFCLAGSQCFRFAGLSVALQGVGKVAVSGR